jgi:electron transfer flavoprotein alpha subunit
VDAGWIGNDTQVGQPGKIIAPEPHLVADVASAVPEIMEALAACARATDP